MSSWYMCFQSYFPQHLISRLMGKFIRCKIPAVRLWQIRTYIKKYKVDLNESEINRAEDFKSFNDFFTRRLRKAARPIAAEANVLVSPADGTLSQLGKPNTQGLLVQAKNHWYSLSDLLADNTLAQGFIKGAFATFYLAPRDYHRVHVPCDAVLEEVIFIPGKLFSVNTRTAEKQEQLFSRNERAVLIFSTQWGKMALVLVGAIIVASIHVTGLGDIAPNATKVLQRWKISRTLNKGDEVGYFQLGSTVIVLTEFDVEWAAHLQPGSGIKMGERVATV